MSISGFGKNRKTGSRIYRPDKGTGSAFLMSDSNNFLQTRDLSSQLDAF